jgi:hypothetical protein
MDSLNQIAQLLGSNTVIGMAQKVGLTPPPPSISVRNLINLADPPLPLAPVDLQPNNGARSVSNDPLIFFRDPGAGTRKAAGQFEFVLLHNGVMLGSPPATGATSISSPVTPFKIGFFTLPPGQITLSVGGRNRTGVGPFSTSTFMVISPTPTPTPTPAHGTLTIRVVIAPFGLQRRIKTVAMVITGPGVPATPIPFQLSQDLSTATALVPLPSPPSGQSAVQYVISATVTFHFNGLINPNSGSISGEEDAEVILSAPTGISWTGQNRLALFSVHFDGFNNVFLMTFEGLS